METTALRVRIVDWVMRMRALPLFAGPDLCRSLARRLWRSVSPRKGGSRGSGGGGLPLLGGFRLPRLRRGPRPAGVAAPRGSAAEDRPAGPARKPSRDGAPGLWDFPGDPRQFPGASATLWRGYPLETLAPEGSGPDRRPPLESLRLAFARLVLGLGLAALSACGFATLGAAGAAAGGGGSDSGTPAALSAFAVDSAQAPAAIVSFLLRDSEAEIATVALYYRLIDDQGAPTDRLITALTSADNPAELDTSPLGIEYAFDWNYAAEPELTDGSIFQDGVLVFALVPGVLDEPISGVNAVLVGLGNDAPEVLEIVVPPLEAQGIVGIPFTVADSSSDPVSVRVEVDFLNDDPDQGFSLATPQFFSTPPEFAFQNLDTSPTGVQAIFGWNTDVDLAAAEGPVRLRFTAVDALVEGPPRLSDAFLIDNNGSPIAVIDAGSLVSSPDRRRGIPIPVRLIDAESDDLAVVVQWREAGGPTFPALPATLAGLEALLGDPAAVQAAGIARSFPRRAEGQIGALGDGRVALPELRDGAAWLTAEDPTGRELLELRPRAFATPLSGAWPATTFDGPVASLSQDAGRTALVLDSQAAVGWRLRAITLADGQEQLIAVGTGEPSAMSFEPGEDSALLAVGTGTDWRLLRVTLDSGAVDTLYLREDPLPSGLLEALESTSRGTALAVLGDALIELDFRSGLDATAYVLADGLAEVRGLALDPLDRNRVLVAEARFDPGSGEEGRLAWFDRRTRNFETVSVPVFAGGTATGETLRAPRALCLSPNGARALVWAEASGSPGVRRLYEIALGALGVSGATSLGDYPGDLSDIDCGPAGEVLAVWTSANELLAVGGIASRRALLGFDGATGEALVDSSAGLQPGARWRVEASAPATLPSSPSGARQLFVWDSAQLGRSGQVEFRATPYDAERGLASQTSVDKSIESTFQVEGQILDAVDVSSTRQALAILSGDHDADGRLDLISAFPAGNVPIDLQLQVAPRVFTGVGAAPFEKNVALLGLVDLLCGDLDGDGDLDLAISDLSSESFGVLRRDDVLLEFTSGIGDRFGGPVETPDPRRIDLADVDGDGDLDLLGNHAEGTAVYLQDATGLFELAQTLDGGTGRPLALALARDGRSGVLTGNLASGPLLHFPAGDTDPFETSADSLGSSVGFDVAELLVADLDLDGGLDLALAGGLQLALLAQGANGLFTGEPQELSTPSAPGGFTPGELAAADENGDGDLELFTAEVGGRLGAEHFGAAGGLPGGTPLPIGSSGSLAATQPGSSGLVVRDLDGDGVLDVVQAAGGGVELFYGADEARFDDDDSVSYGSLTAGSTPRFVLAQDMDGDADLDLVLSNSSGAPRLLTQSTPGSFQVTLLPQTSPPSTSLVLAAGDLDGDGRTDVVSGAGSILRVHFQTAIGEFPAGSSLVLDDAGLFDFADDVSGRGLHLGDADGDGDLDLAFAVAGDEQIGVLVNDLGQFDPAAALLFGDGDLFDSPRAVQLVDANGDGIVDLLAADRVADAILLFPGGPGGLGAAGSITLPASSPYLLTRADVDGDGRPDLITNGASAVELQVLYGLGAGQFAPASSVAIEAAEPTASVCAIQAVDLDLDGDLDLAAKIDGELVLLRQIAPRQFAVLEPEFLGAPGGAGPFSESLVAADVDGDGDPDLVAGDLGGQRLVVRFSSR